MLGYRPQIGADPTPPFRLGYVSALDGVRAFAVLAVIAVHSGFSWIPGGYYGVDCFFVLSGFLITSLLVEERRSTGTIALARFWGRRARRLLPALLLLLVVVSGIVMLRPAIFGVPNFSGSALATLFYSANWYFIATHAGYFALTAHPSPLLHTWSLAIEEQFYLVWPLVVMAVLGARFRRRRPPSERAHQHRLEALLLLASAGAVGSAVWMAVLSPGGADVTRAYYGTDTRAQAVLVGAALAVALARWGPSGTRSSKASRLASLTSIAGVIGVALMWWRVPETSFLAFHGGFLLTAVATAAVVAGVVLAPRVIVARMLSLWPLRMLGRVSYGVYLWYWPVLLVVNGSRTGLTGLQLFAVRVGITIAIAVVSYLALEQPIRRRAPAMRVGPAAAALVAAAMACVLLVPAAPPAADLAALPQPQVPAAAFTSPSGRPVKVLLVGDSIAGSLGVGLGKIASRYGVQLVDMGTPGCSLSMDQVIQVFGVDAPPGLPCRAGDPAALVNTWRSWVDTYNPDVVVYLARGELFNQVVAGKWGNLGQPAFDAWTARRFATGVATLRSRGAAVVILGSVFYDSGESPSGAPWPEDDLSRELVDNSIIEKTASSTPGVTMLNVGTAVSPGDHYTQVSDRLAVRCPDGVHFTPAAGVLVGETLLPKLRRLGEAHSQASAGGAWAGPMPPAVPKWYGGLHCG